MKQGPVLRYIHKKLKRGPLHMTLIDPDKQRPEEAAAMVRDCGRSGTDAIMLGGSTGVDMAKLDATCKAIKKEVDIPIILFPTSSGTISRFADAIYFMSMLNSRDPKFITGEQATAAPVLERWGIETISMGYIVVEPGMRVGRVGRAEVVPRSRSDIAIGYALVARMYGMSLVYLEAGSGADRSVPPGMVRAVRRVLDIPLVVGGGIHTPSDARAAIGAGADIIVTGTVGEESLDRVSGIIKAIKKTGNGSGEVGD